MPFAASLLITAKTIPINVRARFAVLRGSAAGFAHVIGAMQFARAVPTTALADFFGYFSIDFLQQLL